MSRRSSSTLAVLGLLGLEPMSPYELVQTMKTGSIHRVWPRAESKVYEEPKRLAAAGLVRARPDRRSRRTVYEITAAGRRWLAARLAEPGGPVTFESEGALKVLFADHGTRDQLLATIRAMREARLLSIQGDLDQLNSYVEAPPRPGRTHLTALVAELVTRLSEATVDWADWAEDRVMRWDDVGPGDERAHEAIETMQSILRRCKDGLCRYERAEPDGQLASTSGPGGHRRRDVL